MNTVFVVLTVLMSVGFLYVWVDAIITLARIPEAAFRRGPGRKALWIAVLVLTTWVGILLCNYWGHRREVVSATA